MMNSWLENDWEQICQVADCMFGFGLKQRVTQIRGARISRPPPLNAHNLIKRHPAGRFLPRPLRQTEGRGQRPPRGGGGGSLLREVRGSQ